MKAILVMFIVVGWTDVKRPFYENLDKVYWPRGYKTFFMLNSVEHEIFPAHKC